VTFTQRIDRAPARQRTSKGRQGRSASAGRSSSAPAVPGAISATGAGLARADLSLPRGLVLPFMDKPLLFTNRIIWTSTLAMALRSSPITVADNSKLLTFNTSGDYEIAKNLRMTLNGAFSRLWHQFLKKEDYISYQFGTTLTFQF